MTMCRVCLDENNLQVISLTTLYDTRSVGEMIHYCTGVEISIYDNFPQIVCLSCLDSLISASKLKDVCIDSDKTLRYEFKDEEIPMSPPPAVKLESQPDILDLDAFYDKIKQEPQDETSTEYFENPYRDISRLTSGKSRSHTPYIDAKKKKESLLTTFKCYLCNIEFRLRKEKYEHLEATHINEELKCKLCRHKSQTARGLDNHMMLHENPSLLAYMCDICSKHYQKACELRRHIKLAHGDKSKREVKFHCDHCSFRTFSKMNMKRHLNTIHLKIKAFVCRECPEKRYTSKITLDQHMITKHGKETDFSCQCCHRKFPTMSFLRSHMKATCSGSPGAVRERGDPNEYREPLDDADHYRCKLCGLIFEGKGKIAQHYAQRHKHSNACELCSATFNSYSNLKKHIQILHNKIHKYSCSFCSRSFGQKNQLQSHVNTHTGEKPFKCKFDFCTFRSGDLSAVSKHQKKCSNNPVNFI